VGLLVAVRPWLWSVAGLIPRLTVAFALTVCVSLLVFSALPAGRLAMRNLKETFLLLLKRDRESVA